jgi:hypothetical protein
MLTPQQPAGQQEGSRVDVLMATKLLERSLGAFGAPSPEGKAILKALSSLGAAFGKTERGSEQLMPAELRHMIGQFAGPGMPGAPPGAGAPPPGAAPAVPPGVGA